ncbi:S8 family serine peptidase [Mangrovimonas sp. TPBH4]|uniref:S8 family serine peptidase n=1 Tax=Mangrovimonas sp. TPBH4 TaxID=1645914 RepID=UPI0006B6739C|nr:S8 family serine peptidase [Mangrovimonas sp. TPBH4]
MELKSIIKYSLMGTFGLTLWNCQPDSTDQLYEEVETISFLESKVISGSYIVVYNNANERMAPLPKVKSLGEYTSQKEVLKRRVLNDFEKIGLDDSSITETFGHAVKGFTANLSETQLQNLQSDPRVLRIEQNYTISISPYKGKPDKGGGSGSTNSQQIPYGTTRVGGGSSASSHTAWIIDSGIDLDHPDLNVDAARSVSFLSGGGGASSPNDQNGHGTHVAGTIAAIDNSIGSVGVAPGTTVVAVRVLDRRGSGSLSGVIAGVDYVAAEGVEGDVANMSLGGGISLTLDNAVINAAQSGVKFVLAAGNESNSANSHSPARANGANIYTISAMDSNDYWAYFSNYGNPPVDYCAPGVGVYSTWKNGDYNTISGTSMAAPHAAGVLLLGTPSGDGTVDGDPDGNADAIIHL